MEVYRSGGGGVCQDQSDDSTHRDGEICGPIIANQTILASKERMQVLKLRVADENDGGVEFSDSDLLRKSVQ